MGMPARPRPGPVKLQVTAALLALALGLLIYLLARAHDRVVIFSALPPLDLPTWSGSGLLLSLPSALNTYAFILLFFSLLPDRLESLFSVCLFWTLFEMLMELGQRQDIALAITQWLPGRFQDYPLLQLLPNYFFNGRCDTMDQVAVLFGTLDAAATALSLRAPPGEQGAE